MYIYFQHIAKVRGCDIGFISWSNLIPIHAHLLLSLLFDFKKVSLDPEVGAASLLGLPCAPRQAMAGAAQPHHILDATRLFGPLDSQPNSKSIVKLSHTALLGQPQPRVSNLSILRVRSGVGTS